MTSAFQIGDKVDQNHSNHLEGTVIAVLTNRDGERRYAVEMPGHNSLQLVSADSLAPLGGAGK